MLQRKVLPFGKVPLGIAASFTVEKRLHGQDYSNLLKALEDAGNGLLWDDDRWFDEVGVGHKALGPASFTLEVYELR